VFIPIAEDTGLIVDLGRWALDELGQLLERWGADPVFSALVASVNVSGLHLMADLASDIQAVMEHYDIGPDRMMIELTETHLMADLAVTRATLEAISALGVSIALDDFGTGYSSLAYLASLPSRTIKIDRSFVEHLETDDKARALVAAICTVCDAFERLVVIEGIETEAQCTIAVELGAKVLQGYLFGRPVPIVEFEASVRAGAFNATAPTERVDAPPRG
jgi:EAL domain-containing protein (putative c-di-GMP-specific phosphodiesterase class I)